jgi:PAS domain S-box-containing protein
MSKGAGQKRASPGRKAARQPAGAELPLEAEAVLNAIHENQIDALVVKRGASESILALHNIEDLKHAAAQLKQAGVELRLADSARQELEARFETLAMHAPVGIFMNDAADDCVYVNQRGREIVGAAAKEALGRGLATTIHPEDRERVLRERAQAMAEGTPFECEFRYCSPDGRVVWVAKKSVPLPGDGRGRIGTLSDVTDHKLADEALRESRQHLQSLLEERERLTQDLHDGCIQSIYAIGLNLQSCRQMLDDNPKAARMVAVAAASLNLVIQELRAFISGHAVAAKPDLEREIERAVRAGRDLGLAFVMEIDHAVAQALTADQASHLQQIAREAISNATRHAKAKSVRVRLGASQGWLHLGVTDDGAGFDPDAQEKSGLGLHHIVARARALKGRAEILSTPGTGTSVVVQVPLAR